ncbi:MAG TPA: FtsX-like permease family protein [Clostridia bacterium]|nr:FtsX-like permease family protein [Clostridia bacterium]
MKTLNRMLLREIIKNKGQFIAAAAVVFVGIALFAGSYMSYKNLGNSMNYYYKTYNFLDYYAEAQKISPQAVKQVENLKGVKNAIGRISQEVGADMGNDKRVMLRLVSLPDDKQPDINKVLLVSGDYLSAKTNNVCLLNKIFANYYKLKKGDSIKTVINKKIFEFKISGIVESPEFIYAIKSPASVLPSEDDYGIIFIKESVARNIFGYGDSCNQLHVLFEPGVKRAPIIDKIEKILKPYGFYGGVERKDQLSNMMLADDVGMLEEVGYMFPVMFLTVAAMIIYVMQRRIINTQRTLIGVMKAFGYTNGRILRYYLKQSLLIALSGAIPAIFVGYYLSIAITTVYSKMVRIQVIKINMYWNVLFIGLGLSVMFCILAGYISAKRILKIEPAQAMRSETPVSGKNIFVERIHILWNNLSFGWKMSIRNIFRAPSRTMFTMLGFVATIMLFMLPVFLFDSINGIIDKQFDVYQRQDYTLAFSKPTPYHDVKELEGVKGIRESVPIIELPIKVSSGLKSQEIKMVGFEEGKFSYKILNNKQKVVKLPQKGVLLSKVIADRLRVKPGDTVTIEFQEGVTDLKGKKVKVRGVFEQYAGFTCYARLDEVCNILSEGRFATGALIKAKSGMNDTVIKELLKISGVKSIDSRIGDKKNFLKVMDLINLFIIIMVSFGGVMGFASIFNATVINIMERRRELASLKVLGYTKREIENVIMRENVILGILSLIPGAIIGRLMCQLFGKMMSNDLIFLPIIISYRTYIVAFISIFVFIYLAQKANKKGISGLDMVEVLKNREG